MPSANQYVERFSAAFTRIPIRVNLARSAVANYRAGNKSYFKKLCDVWLISQNYDKPYMDNTDDYYDCLVDSAEKAIRLYEQNAG